MDMEGSKLFSLAFLVLCALRQVYGADTATYEISNISEVSYGEIIYSSKLRSDIECASKCSEDESCRSTLFDPVSKDCMGNRWTLDLSGLVCGTQADCSGSTVVLYEKKLLQTTMRLACHSDADCVDPLSECRGNQCICEPGYSYNEHIYECVSSCDTYGTTFQPDEGKANQAFINGISLDVCLSRCISETSFLCKTTEYRPGACYLQDYTKLDRPDIYNEAVTYVLYTRDCL